MCCAEGASRKGNFILQEDIYEVNGGIAVDVIIHHSANEILLVSSLVTRSPSTEKTKSIRDLLNFL